jgi:hypothetical protein
MAIDSPGVMRAIGIAVHIMSAGTSGLPLDGRFDALVREGRAA